MKITLITVCWNSAAVIRTALESVLSQKPSSPEGSAAPRGCELEYLVIDGGSTDGTVEILKEYEAKFLKELPTGGTRSVASATGTEAGPPNSQPSTLSTITFRWLSERDAGMYDAMNKGIRMATGDVIGILNADDVLAEDDTLAKIAAAFEADPTLDGTYADIRFVRDTPTLTPQPPTTNHQQLATLRSLPPSRYCSGRRFRPWMFRFGTQTAHPSTFFCRSCFERWGEYSLNYGMYGDFDLLLRFIWKNRANMRYLPICTTVMRTGGASTNGWRATVKINKTDLRVIRDNGYYSNLLFLYSRYFFKVWGFIFKEGKKR